MSKAYCGIGKVPSGRKIGSAKECLDMNQVRYYGLNAVDPKSLRKSKSGKKIKEVWVDLLKKSNMLKLKKSRVEKDLIYEKDPKKRKELKKTIKKYVDFLAELSAVMKKYKASHPDYLGKY